MASLAKPITSAKSASDLAEMLVTPPESKEGNLMRNKGSDIDLNALYQQSQPQTGFGMGVGIMNTGPQMMQQQVPNFSAQQQQGNAMAGNKMFHIGSQHNNQMNGNPENNNQSMGFDSIFGQPNVRPTRSAPQPPSQLNMNGQLFPQQQPMTPNNSPMPAAQMNPFQMNSPGAASQQPFPNQNTLSSGPSIMPNMALAPSLASVNSTPNLSSSTGFTTTELPMVDSAVTNFGQDPFTSLGNNNAASVGNNQLAVGNALNINFPKSMSTGSFQTTVSMTEPGSIDLSLTPGSTDFSMFDAKPETNASAPVAESTAEEGHDKKKFSGFPFLQRNTEIVEGLIDDKDKSKNDNKTDAIDGLEPIAIPDESEGVSNTESKSNVNSESNEESEKSDSNLAKGSENESTEESKDDTGKEIFLLDMMNSSRSRQRYQLYF